MGNHLGITTSERVREADGTQWDGVGNISCWDIATKTVTNSSGAVNLGWPLRVVLNHARERAPQPRNDQSLDAGWPQRHVTLGKVALFSQQSQYLGNECVSPREGILDGRTMHLLEGEHVVLISAVLSLCCYGHFSLVADSGASLSW